MLRPSSFGLRSTADSSFVSSATRSNILCPISAWRFPASKTHGTFYFVSGLQKFNDIAKFRLVVVLLDFGTEAHFLDFDDLLIFAGFLLFLLHSHNDICRNPLSGKPGFGL